MISVDPKDRDVLRFLWVKDIYANQPEIIVLRFARVVLIHHHVKQYMEVHPDLVEKLMQSTYVNQ